MRITHIIIFVILMVSGVAFSQTDKQAEIKKTFTSEQKGYLSNTWYESPKESDGDIIVYRLTQYNVIIGKDYFTFDPGKLILGNDGKFSAESLKLNSTEDPHQTDSGSWKFEGQNIILTFENEIRKLPVVSIEKDKLVVKIK